MGKSKNLGLAILTKRSFSQYGICLVLRFSIRTSLGYLTEHSFILSTMTYFLEIIYNLTYHLICFGWLRNTPNLWSPNTGLLWPQWLCERSTETLKVSSLSHWKPNFLYQQLSCIVSVAVNQLLELHHFIMHLTNLSAQGNMSSSSTICSQKYSVTSSHCQHI